MSVAVESRMGAVAWGPWPSPRFPSPLIKPDVPISGIRLSDWLHRETCDGGRSGQALEARNAEFSMNDIECKSAIAAPLHLVPSREKPAQSFKDVLIDGYGMPCPANRSQSSWTSLAMTCSARHVLPA